MQGDTMPEKLLSKACSAVVDHATWGNQVSVTHQNTIALLIRSPSYKNLNSVYFLPHLIIMCKFLLGNASRKKKKICCKWYWYTQWAASLGAGSRPGAVPPFPPDSWYGSSVALARNWITSSTAPGSAYSKCTAILLAILVCFSSDPNRLSEKLF